MSALGFFGTRFGLAAIVAVVAVGAILWIYEEGKEAGGDAVRADSIEKTIETQRRIDDAEARGPRTPDDVDQRLRDGKF